MKHYLFIGLLAGLLMGCESKTNPFAITKHSIGLLTDSTKINQLKVVFINDSISKYIGGDEFTGSTNTISVYEKGTGTLLLELNPNYSLDSLSTIRTVRVMDKRFKNKDGLNTLMAEEPRTIIFYESPHKLIKTLSHICEYFGEDRQMWS